MTRPFDSVYGAGQLDINRSHRVLTEGDWRYATITKNRDHEITFEVNAPQMDASVVLIWNRQVGMKRGKVSSVGVADMALRLYKEDILTGDRYLVQESDSRNENREHVYVRGLKVGRYVMVLETDREVSYGLAWHLGRKPTPSLVWNDQSMQADGLMPGEYYEWQHTADLKAWTVVEAFEAKRETQVFDVELGEAVKGFYRLTWARSEAES